MPRLLVACLLGAALVACGEGTSDADRAPPPRPHVVLVLVDQLRADSMEAHAPGLMALAERGVRFVQLYHRGWDQHGSLISALPKQCNDTDQACAALVTDLKQRGMLDETLVVWGGEFGRQPTAEYAKGTGRDHNSYGFTMWMAGGGIKGGTSVGTTDELGSKAVENRYHVKNLHATILNQLGFDPNKLTYFYDGLDQRLVGVEHVNPIKQIIA